MGVRWCDDCQQALTPLTQPLCEICGLPQANNGICRACTNSRPHYDIMRSWVVFKPPAQQALHRLKYKNTYWLGETLATIMYPALQKTGWDFEIIIPIPLSQQRRVERGYNQVEEIARPLAWNGNWICQPNALQRVKHTQSQVKLNAVQRKENVKGAFQADPHLVAGKNVLILDDVITTGATVSEAAIALKTAGAKQVYAYSFARALAHSDLDKI